MSLLTIVESEASSILQFIEKELGIVVNEGEKLYNQLTDAEKQAAQWGSGVISVVNTNIDKTPVEIIGLIQTAFPGLDLDVIHGFLDEILAKISNVQAEVPVTLEDAVSLLQSYLKQFEGNDNFLGIMSKAIVTAITLLFSPESIPQKIEGALEFLYHLIIKPHTTAVSN